MKNPKIYFLLLFFLNISSAFAQYEWQERANFGGSAREGAYGFSIDSLGYIGGGYDGGNLTDFWQYSPTTNSWTQKSDAPVAVRYASTFVINGKGYLTCGIGDSGFELYMFDPTTNTWSSKAAFIGSARYGAASFSVGTNGYVGVGNGGGAYGPYYNDFYEYDAIADSWTQKTSFPGAVRYGSYGISLNGVGYLGFGNDQNLGISYRDWYAYNPSTDSWTGKASFPGTSRQYIGGFSINNLIYAGAGMINESTPIADFYEYNPVADSWSRKQNYGGGSRWLVASFSIGNIGYFGTGLDSASDNDDDFWEYAPVVIPTASFQSSDRIFCAYSCVDYTNQSSNSTSWQWSFPGATPDTSTAQNPNGICYYTAGSFGVTLIASDSSSSDTLTYNNYITVYPSPIAPSIYRRGDTLFCTTQPTYTFYQWFYNDSIIAGANDTFFVATQTGNYNTEVRDENGCSIAVGINVILGVSEIDANSYFTLYPNPVSEELNISMLSAFHDGDIEVTDVLGRKLFQQTFDAAKDNNLSIDFRSFASGLYFVSVTSNGERVTRKVIKESALK